jgi:N-methylhydantoinase B
MLEEYALVPDSAGAGTFRGGLGMARQLRALADGTTLSVRSDAHVVPAPGVHGGLASGVTRIVKNPGTPEEEVLHSKASGIVLKAGETVRVETLGGGGYGAPTGRDPARLARDIAEGKVSEAAALRDYGPELLTKARDKLG